VSEALPLFTEGTEYRATVQPGYPLTILLEPGEHPLKVIGGDRPLLAEGEVAPWQVAVTPAEAPRANIFVTVTRPGLRMGLVVATDRRTYLLNLTSVGLTTTRVLRWRYDVSSVVAAPPPAPPGPLPALPFRLHVGYQVQTTQGHQPEWVPRVYDDGMKVYIVFPGTMLFQEAPLLRGIGVNGPYLLNSRQAGRVVIVDQLASRLELRLGIGAQAEVVQVVRGVLETIQCPGHAQCPTW
jgi:type IV secretion system protein VirB9